MRCILLILVLGSTGSGCSYGMKVGHFVPASGPRGVITRVAVGSSTFDAELIEIRGTGLLVLQNPGADPSSSGGPETRPRLRSLPYGSIRSARFEQTNVAIADGVPPSQKDIRRLRLLSRFPQGVSPELLQALLHAYGQEQVEGAQP